MQVKEGTLWGSADGKKFRVLHIVKDDDANTWVHYRDELKGFDKSNSREYSCFLESFTARFSILPE